MYIAFVRILSFQSTLPRGERRNTRSSQRSAHKFQSTLPRGERLVRCHHHASKRYISIHAPARGATEYSFKSAICSQISIHAPARGATCPLPSPCVQKIYFNPRSREGSDSTPCVANRVASVFQSTLPRGERRFFNAPTFATCEISIHAPARGATAVSLRSTMATLDFNPRSREGSDASDTLSIKVFNISIHAPARGATPDRDPDYVLALISIHAPARGATVH